MTFQERKKFQTLFITLSFKYSINKKRRLDDIKYLKDYSSIVKFLKMFVEKSQYKSLERLVFECSNALVDSTLSANFRLVVQYLCCSVTLESLGISIGASFSSIIRAVSVLKGIFNVVSICFLNLSYDF